MRNSPVYFLETKGKTKNNILICTPKKIFYKYDKRDIIYYFL